MHEKQLRLIREQYLRQGSGATELLRTVLVVGSEIGRDQALALLEQCVTEKRVSWLARELGAVKRTGDPVLDGYRVFYEMYLRVSVPCDGQIVEQTDTRLVSRWWNHCPTLEACQQLGLDTREVCRKAYHKPAQVFLSEIDPNLVFERNYQFVRPHTPYCEEIIRIDR